MPDDFLRLVEAQRPALASCPVCPAKGACVFVTPGYEPGYCLHEYRLVHAFVARRLRARGPGRVSDWTRLAQEAADFAARLAGTRAQGAGGLGVPLGPAWPSQATLGRFGMA